jgi:hypothetical protein
MSTDITADIASDAPPTMEGLPPAIDVASCPSVRRYSAP